MTKMLGWVGYAEMFNQVWVCSKSSSMLDCFFQIQLSVVLRISTAHDVRVIGTRTFTTKEISSPKKKLVSEI